MIKPRFINFLPLLIASKLMAGDVSEVLDKKIIRIENQNCEMTKSCHLVSFQLNIYKSKSQYNNGPARYNVMMEGFYETTSNEHLEEFAVVQFIKGSVKEYGVTSDFERFAIRTYFGEKWKKMNYPDWQIDSIDEDPIYKSFFHPKQKKWYRHGAYEVNDAQNSLIYDDYEKVFYLYEKPKKAARLYFSDTPSGSNTSSSIIRESMLEFKTCIYRTEDVPAVVDPKNTDFAEPIHCIEWDGKFKYNEATGDFEVQ